MKFIEGVLFGGMVTAGALLLYSNGNSKMDSKKIMRKGKQFVRKLGII